MVACFCEATWGHQPEDTADLGTLVAVDAALVEGTIVDLSDVGGRTRARPQPIAPRGAMAVQFHEIRDEGVEIS